MDIYNRIESDPQWIKNVMEHSDDIETIVQTVKNIILTRKGDVLGYPDFGLNLEDRLWSTGQNERQILRELYAQVRLYCPLASQYDYKSKAGFIRGASSDSCLIEIFLNDEKMLGIYANGK